MVNILFQTLVKAPQKRHSRELSYLKLQIYMNVPPILPRPGYVNIYNQLLVYNTATYSIL